MSSGLSRPNQHIQNLQITGRQEERQSEESPETRPALRVWISGVTVETRGVGSASKSYEEAFSGL